MAKLKEFDDAHRYFAEVYGELLNMKTTQSLKQIFDKTESFIKGVIDIDKKNRKEPMSASQLRNVYARIKKAKNPDELRLLRPLLAYTSARQKSEGGKMIIALIDGLIQDIDSQKDKDPKKSTQVESLKTFAEAIVAYHKYHHPKQS